MANRRFTQFFYTPHMMPVLLDFNFVVGASGAVGTLKGPGIASVTKLAAAGTYKVKLQDNYNRYYGGTAGCVAPLSGTPVTAGAFVVGTLYVITSVGSTDWQAAGLDIGITAAPGVAFVATTVGAGTGTAEEPDPSSVAAVQVVGNTNLTLNPQGPNNIGGVLYLQCLDFAGSPVNPVAGSFLGATIYLSNSSVQVQGE